MADRLILNDEPVHHIDEFVDEVLGRRQHVVQVALREPLKKMITGLVDQLWMRALAGDIVMEKDQIDFALEWLNDGRMLVHMTYKDRYGKRVVLAPKDIRPWGG